LKRFIGWDLITDGKLWIPFGKACCVAIQILALPTKGLIQRIKRR
jgi:hypothetical protein